MVLGVLSHQSQMPPVVVGLPVETFTSSICSNPVIVVEPRALAPSLVNRGGVPAFRAVGAGDSGAKSLEPFVFTLFERCQERSPDKVFGVVIVEVGRRGVVRDAVH